MITCKFITIKRYWLALLYNAFYQLILLLGYYVLFGGFGLVGKVFDVSVVGANISEYRSDGYFIIYDRHECRLELVMRNVEFFC